MAVDIAGWGSTVEASPKPYRHVPVQIVPPGNVDSVSGYTYISLVINLNITLSDGRRPRNFEDS